MALGLGLGLGFSGGGSRPFTAPAALNWDYESDIGKIVQTGRTYQAPGFNPKSIIPETGNDYWVDRANGSDSNDGSESTPFRGIQAALDATNPRRIYLKPGYYNANHNGWFGSEPSFSGDVAIIGIGKAVIHAARFNTNTFTKTAAQTNVYEMSFTTAQQGNVVDLNNEDSDGDPIRLELVTSIAEVDSTPNSYYNTGDTLYIHTFDSRAPADDEILPFNSVLKCLPVQDDVNVYLENIEFWGGTDAFAAQFVTSPTGKTIHLVNCRALYANAPGFDVDNDFDLVTFKNCEAKYNDTDGFNYDGPDLNILEWNCKSTKNGFTGSSNSVNGSSMHLAGNIIRLNGEYGEGEGPSIADVDDGTQSLALGVKALESLATTQNGTQDTGFRVTDAAMWMKDCTAVDSYYDRVNVNGYISDLGGFTGSGSNGDSGVIANGIPRFLPLDELINGAARDWSATSSDSYPGTGDSWTDLVASDVLERGYGVAGSEPAFEGTAGTTSAVWAFDGTDSFQDAAIAAPLTDLHKDGAEWFAVFLIEAGASMASATILDTWDGSEGVRCSATSTGFLRAFQGGGGSIVGLNANLGDLPTSQWFYLAIGYDASKFYHAINTRTISEVSYTHTATTTDATAFGIMARIDGSSAVPDGAALKDVLLFNNQTLDNTNLTAALDVLQKRNPNISLL